MQIDSDYVKSKNCFSNYNYIKSVSIYGIKIIKSWLNYKKYSRFYSKYEYLKMHLSNLKIKIP